MIVEALICLFIALCITVLVEFIYSEILLLKQYNNRHERRDGGWEARNGQKGRIRFIFLITLIALSTIFMIDYLTMSFNDKEGNNSFGGKVNGIGDDNVNDNDVNNNYIGGSYGVILGFLMSSINNPGPIKLPVGGNDDISNDANIIHNNNNYHDDFGFQSIDSIVTEMGKYFPGTCKCRVPPVYDKFPNPHHTNSSYAVFNFFNNDKTGLPVWVTIVSTADSKMHDDNPGFEIGYSYVYVDAELVLPGELFSYTFDRSTLAGDRLGGGRVYVYYKDPFQHDSLRFGKYGSRYPVQKPGSAPIRIEGHFGERRIPSDSFRQMIEFTIDYNPGEDSFTRGFIDYDISCVDDISLPVYVFGGNDKRTLPNATKGNYNNGFPCNRAYIGCSNFVSQLHEGCPTQIEEKTDRGMKCISSIKYCELPTELIKNISHWNIYCHQWDAIARNFGITEEKLKFYRDCVEKKTNIPDCPAIPPPLVRTPTNAIYSCIGHFLFENHCLPQSREFGTRLDGTMCSALNRGLCEKPDYDYAPRPQGLSCATFGCGGQPKTSCFIPCFNSSCFGFTCKDFPSIIRNLTCLGQTCDVDTRSGGCNDFTGTKNKIRVSTCNDSSSDPYNKNLSVNEYAKWVRGRGENFYGFSLDEEIGGGNQQCLFSTQLDIVISPQCGGNT